MGIYTTHTYKSHVFLYSKNNNKNLGGKKPKCCFCFKSTEITGGGKGGGFSESAVRLNKFRKPGANCRGAGRGCHQIPRGEQREGRRGRELGRGRVEGGTMQQLVQLCGLCCPPFLPLNCSLNSSAFMATWTSPGIVRLQYRVRGLIGMAWFYFLK